MVLAENLLQTKLTLKAEKEYLQKITMKLRETMLDHQFHVVFSKKKKVSLFFGYLIQKQ